MKSAFAAVLTCICFLRAPISFAETPTFDFDCDTPLGHYSQWKGTHRADTVRIQGIIKVLALRREDNWVPGAHVYVYGKDGTALMGLILGIDKVDPTKLRASVLGPASRQSREAFASVTWKNASIPFEVELASHGILKFSVAGNSQTVATLGFTPMAVGFRCTSGDFLFGGIEITP